MRANDLTVGEKLFLLRKRKLIPQSMAQAAAEYGVSLYRYRMWERDTETPSKKEVGSLALGKITRQDEYMILRRRSGKTALELCKELHCCQWWYRLMETGQVDDSLLRSYWGLK